MVVEPSPKQREVIGDILEKDQVYSALTAAIVAKANENFEERHARNRNLYMTLAAIAFSLISAGLTFAINEVINIRIAQSVELAINSRVGSLDFASRLASLNALVDRIDQSDTLSVSDAERAVDQIEFLFNRFASDQAIESGLSSQRVIEYRNDLTHAVETMARNLAAAKNDVMILRLTEIAPTITAKSGPVTETLVQNYGKDLLAAPAGAADWQSTDGSSRAVFEKYREYAGRADAQRYPELFIAFELLVRHLEGRSREEIENLAARIEDLIDVDHDNFRALMFGLATERFWIESNSKSRLVAQRVRGFLDEYADASPTLRDIRDELAAQPN